MKESTVAHALLSEVRSWFRMNGEVSAHSMFVLRLFWIGVFALVWHFVPGLPSPAQMLQAFTHFILKGGLIGDILTSLSVNIRAILLTCMISLGMVYLSVFGIMRPVVEILSKLRFISPAALLVIFMMYAPNGDWLKVIILTFGMSVYFITDMAAEIIKIKKEEYNEARTLGLPEWKVTREVVIFGKADEAFKALRVNAGIGWAMIALVEGLVKNEGGIGAVFIAQERHVHLDGMFALGALLLVVGLAQDWVIATIARLVCRHSYTDQGRRS